MKKNLEELKIATKNADEKVRKLETEKKRNEKFINALQEKVNIWMFEVDETSPCQVKFCRNEIFYVTMTVARLNNFKKK